MKTRQINVRLTPQLTAALERRVREANERAKKAGLPMTVTVSALIRLWIEERLKEKQ